MQRKSGWGTPCALTALVGSVSVAACDAPTAMTVAQDVAASLSIVANRNASADDLVLEVGDTITVSAVATNPLGLTVPAGAVTWSSSNTAVAEIDGTGLVSAVGVGTADIRAATAEAVSSLTTIVNDSASF
ncbi:MAG: Ig-like domain-containing protein [Gemmatimonadales bacterium]